VVERTVRYAAVMFGASTLFSLLNFAASVTSMVARSKDTYGDYATYVRIYTFSQGFLIFGVNQVVQRFSAADPERRKDFAAAALRGFALLALLCWTTGAVIASLGRVSVGLGVAAIPSTVVWWWSRYLIRTDLAGGREAFVTGVQSLLITVLQIVLVTTTTWDLALVVADFTAVLIGGLVGLQFIPRVVGAPLGALARRPLNGPLLREAFAFGRSYWVAGQLFALGDNATAGLIRSLLGPAAMGASAAAQQFWQFVLKPMEFLGQGALPMLVSAPDRAAREKAYFDLMKLCLLVLPAVAVAATTGLPLLFELIDLIAQQVGYQGQPVTEKYAEVPRLIALMTLQTPAMTFVMVWNQYAVAIGEPKVSIGVQLASAGALLVSIAPLIGGFGLTGAYLAGALAAFASALVFPAMLGRRYPSETRRGVAWMVGATGATVAALAITRVWPPHLPSWLAAAPALVVYAVTSALLGLAGRAEAEFVVGLVRRRLGR
jgi:O-antigen/teichoic acid export membrane protein